MNWKNLQSRHSPGTFSVRAILPALYSLIQAYLGLEGRLTPMSAYALDSKFESSGTYHPLVIREMKYTPAFLKVLLINCVHSNKGLLQEFTGQFSLKPSMGYKGWELTFSRRNTWYKMGSGKGRLHVRTCYHDNRFILNQEPLLPVVSECFTAFFRSKGITVEDLTGELK